ncbi:MAG: AAA family ATPase [Gammaproteobacteria bacterium]|nr:AAA family ATPase [Gammaproteobacteria bacterium]
MREPQLVETHISWVLLSGDYAYKIKKPVDLGFLDFSTPDKRRFYCEEELRLNSRLAPDIYLEVVPVTGTPESPAIQGEGPVVDHAVKMRQFPQEGLLDRRLEQGLVRAADIDHMAAVVAAFHRDIPAAHGDGGKGNPGGILEPALENFRHLRAHTPDDLAPALETLERWTRDTFAALAGVFAARRAGGFVRECHGDMHLGNMAEVDGELRIFDGIEFSAALRWIDVMSEAAFVMTDLNHRGRADFGWRFINRYLEETADYDGLAVLAFYRVYRIMVRAKVAAIRLEQLSPDSEEWRADKAEVERYVAQALGVTAAPEPTLILTRGVSGSGKSWLSQGLVEHLGAVRLRSDVERKRLFGLARDADSGALPGAGIYTPEAGRRTFEQLRVQARGVLRAGLTAIVDATFLATAHRRPFLELAAAEGVPCLVLDVTLDPDTARRRVEERAARGDDPSEAGVEVLERQLADYAPLEKEKGARVLGIDGASPPAPEALATAVRARLEAFT